MLNVINHWKYFLSLESEVKYSLRYVEYTDSQELVYSFEFSRLLLLTCAELDVLFKVLCNSINQSAQADSISKYFDTISTKYDVVSEEVSIPLYSKVNYPFSGWSQNQSPDWWTACNKIKHHRHTDFQLGNLRNVIQSISGLFIINLITLHETNILSKVYDHPLLIDRDQKPLSLMAETSYEVKLKN